MTWTSYKLANSCVQASRPGSTGKVISNTSSILNDNDNNLFTDTGSLKNSYSDWIRLTQFGFDGVDGVPVDATINGIEAYFYRKTNSGVGRVRDDAVYLRTSSGQVGNNGATSTQYSGSWVGESHGGASDMWGTSLTASDIRASNFGIDISAIETVNRTQYAQYDYVYIRVDYTAASTGGGIDVYNGSSWDSQRPVKVWNGSSWETKPLKRWNGSSWVLS